MSKRKIDPVMASKQEGSFSGWNSITVSPVPERKITRFRSKDRPRPRGAVHALADQMMKEDNP